MAVPHKKIWTFGTAAFAVFSVVIGGRMADVPYNWFIIALMGCGLLATVPLAPPVSITTKSKLFDMMFSLNLS